jgi:hypothetical protein
MKDGGAAILCDPSTPCPEGLVCIAGVCEVGGLVDAGGDAGAPGARMQVCTPEGCDPPWRMAFGGSRIGVATAQTLTIRSVGEDPLLVQNIEVRALGSEFTSDPSGDLDLVLMPNEEQAVRITHVARDGLEDDDALEIISNAQMVRTLVQLETEYKGVPSLYVGTDPASNAMNVRVVDFGTVLSGTPSSRILYVKNADRVIDGSILEIREARIDPASSTTFEVALDRAIPAFLSQFTSLCNTDGNCRADLGDTCDATLGVCAESAGPLRDVLTAEVRFVGTTPGIVEEDLLLLTNDGGGDPIATRVILRATVTNSQIAIAPDPVEFPEAFIGFTARKTVTVTNGGSAPLALLGVSLTQTGTFSLDLSGLTFPWTVAPMDTATFDVLYDPPVIGAHASILVVDSDDPIDPSRSINVGGNAFTAPELELVPASIDFGDTHTQVGALSSATVVVTARNAGGHELRVSSLLTSLGTPNGFSVDPSSLPPIPPGQDATFNVRYSPLAPSFPNVESGSVLVVSNDPRIQPELVVPIAGRGVNPNAVAIPGTSVNFNDLLQNPNRPEIYVGQQLATQVTVVNGGFGPLTVTAISIQGDARGAFSISGAPPAPFVVSQGGNVVLSLAYAAPTPGTDGATVEVRTNDLDLPGGLLLLNLIGSTVACPPVSGATGSANGSGACTYACAAGFADLNGDLNTPASDGCEYACTIQGTDDLPDDAYVDRNCDGIDGTVLDAVFVSTLGSDANPGTSALPVRTMAYGLALAASQGLDVYVAAGAYTEAATIDLPNGVSIYGGFGAVDWQSRSSGNLTSIAVTAPIAVRATNVSAPTVLDHLEIEGGDGPSAYGIFATSSDGLTVRRSTIVAGRGGGGADGLSPGGVAASGGGGGSGEPGCEDSGGFCSGCGRPTGGIGGGSACGRGGGAGGRPGHEDSFGDTGGQGAGGTPGGPGTPDDGGNWNTPVQYWGATGLDGASGLDGAAGQPAFGSLGYAPTGGGGGGPGGHGNGGGGGGGGGGGDADCDSYGGAGGGGGGGGCGGVPATGGTSGGGSFGIYLWSSNARLELLVIRTGGGGRGGTGGTGQPGGSGGAGGWGGDPSRPGSGNQYGGGGEQDDGSNGGRGGNGGAGGRGGHGGGGAGGPSIGVVRGNGSAPVIAGNLTTLGAAGLGGASPGMAGADGVRQDVYP